MQNTHKWKSVKGKERRSGRMGLSEKLDIIIHIPILIDTPFLV